MIKLSIIMPFLNSHELVRRQLLHFTKIGLNDLSEVELIIVDDGSDSPIVANNCKLKNLIIFATNDKRPWTSSLARNRVARDVAKGETLFMIDGDYILTKKSIEVALNLQYDYLGVRRKLGILDEYGVLDYSIETLIQWGAPRWYLEAKQGKLPPHPNQYVIRKEIFLKLGGYNEKMILANPYPQGEDNDFKKRRTRAVDSGEITMPPDDIREWIYMFPNGQYCGDLDANPFGLFHKLSRKTDVNPWNRDEPRFGGNEVVWDADGNRREP